MLGCFTGLLTCASTDGALKSRVVQEEWHDELHDGFKNGMIIVIFNSREINCSQDGSDRIMPLCTPIKQF